MWPEWLVFLSSGLHAVFCWAGVSGGHPAAGEDGPVEQNCFWLPGDNLEYLSLVCVCVEGLRCAEVSLLLSSDPPEGRRQHAGVLWRLFWGGGRGCVCQVHHRICASSLLFGLEEQQLMDWFVLPAGTSLMFGGLNANVTATCPLAWQPTTMQNPQSVATSGQTTPLSVLNVADTKH